VRYTELNVRHAVRLDHSTNGNEDEAHPLMNMLAADEHFDPAVAVARDQEAAVLDDADPLPHESLAGAYVHLLRRFDNRMTAVADHLLISLGYCYHRCSHAKILAMHQRTLPTGSASVEFIPKPWRPYRLVARPVQLCFGFGAEDELFDLSGAAPA